jgi:opacity protein-like surface antigen
MRRVIGTALLGFVLGMCMPVQARAAEFINPWAGLVFGNEQATSGFHSIGFSFGDAGHGLVGTETNIGLAPGFFGDGVENYVLDLMAGFIIGPTLQSKAKDEYRPFGLVEFGTIRTSIDGLGTGAHFARNDIGIALGGGCTVALNDRLQLRGEVRYIKAINAKDAANSLNANLQDFHYWRSSIGLVIH